MVGGGRKLTSIMMRQMVRRENNGVLGSLHPTPCVTGRQQDRVLPLIMDGPISDMKTTNTGDSDGDTIHNIYHPLRS